MENCQTQRHSPQRGHQKERKGSDLNWILKVGISVQKQIRICMKIKWRKGILI